MTKATPVPTRPRPSMAATGPRRGRSTGSVASAAGARMSALAAITTGDDPDRRRPAKPRLHDEAADRVAERRQARPPARRGRRSRSPSGRARRARRRRAIPIATPASREPSERSSGSRRSARSAVKIGAVATRIPASDEEIAPSPAEISRNGPATWIAPRTTRVPSLPRSGASSPRDAANGTRTAAASAIRVNATISGERSRSPILISR